MNINSNLANLAIAKSGCTAPDAAQAVSSTISCKHCGEEPNIAGSDPDDLDKDDEQLREFEQSHATSGKPDSATVCPKPVLVGVLSQLITAPPPECSI